MIAPEADLSQIFRKILSLKGKIFILGQKFYKILLLVCVPKSSALVPMGLSMEKQEKLGWVIMKAWVNMGNMVR